MAQHGAMTDPGRLKKIQQLAARVREQELALVEINLAPGARALTARLQQLRACELAYAAMTDAERAEYRKFEAEMDKDLEEYKIGANSGEWTE